MRELQVDDKIIQPRQVLGRISQAKNRMETPDKVGNGTYRDEQIAKIYDGYVKALERANALDFDDLLLKTVELFEHDGVRAKYQRQFRYVMVDEYQDTNRPQYMLIKHLVGEPAQPRRRRRSGPVDLQVARRRPAQHPRLRARLPRSGDGAPRAQLSLDAEHPRCRLGGDCQQHRSQGEAPLDRAGQGRPGHVLPWRGRTRGSLVHRPRTAQGDDVLAATPRSRSSIDSTRSRARSKTS